MQRKDYLDIMDKLNPLAFTFPRSIPGRRFSIPLPCGDCHDILYRTSQPNDDSNQFDLIPSVSSLVWNGGRAWTSTEQRGMKKVNE